MCDETISLADLLATTAAVVGETLPAAGTAAEDSYNVLPALLGQSAKPARSDIIVHSSDGVYAIRKGPWKWIEGVPAAGIKRKASPEFKAQLYNTQEDPAETRDVTAQNPEVVKELSALLVRYRDGGYSRELPPVVEKVAPKIVEMTKVAGQPLIEESLVSLPAKPWKAMRGTWTPEAGVLWGSNKGAKDTGATLQVPAGFTDGIIDYEIQFQGADRHSLRIEAGGDRKSFRVEVSPVHVGLTKNPDPAKESDPVLPLARKKLELQTGLWYPVRITFKGAETTVQVNETLITGSNPLLAEKKQVLNFIVFGNRAALRNVKVVE